MRLFCGDFVLWPRTDARLGVEKLLARCEVIEARPIRSLPVHFIALVITN